MNTSESIRFNDMAWEDDAPGIRAKETLVNGVRWAIVEYGEGVGREEWCEDGHFGFVLAGEIEYMFDDGRDPVRAAGGEAFFLPASPLGEGAHRGRNVAGTQTRLFLIDDPIPSG